MTIEEIKKSIIKQTFGVGLSKARKLLDEINILENEIKTLKKGQSLPIDSVSKSSCVHEPMSFGNIIICTVCDEIL